MRLLLIILMVGALSACNSEGGANFIGKSSDDGSPGGSIKNLKSMSPFELVPGEQVIIRGTVDDEGGEVEYTLWGLKFPNDNKCKSDARYYINQEIGGLWPLYFVDKGDSAKFYFDEDSEESFNRVLVREGFAVAVGDEFFYEEVSADGELRGGWDTCNSLMKEVSERY